MSTRNVKKKYITALEIFFSTCLTVLILMKLEAVKIITICMDQFKIFLTLRVVTRVFLDIENYSYKNNIKSQQITIAA